MTNTPDKIAKKANQIAKKIYWHPGTTYSVFCCGDQFVARQIGRCSRNWLAEHPDAVMVGTYDHRLDPAVLGNDMREAMR